MTSFTDIEQIANSFPEVTVEPHFEKISFRVNKKIFVTYDEPKTSITVKLSTEQQAHYIAAIPAIAPVPNKWGEQGWTVVKLEEIEPERLREVIRSAYCEVAPPKLAKQLQNNENQKG